MSSAPVQSERWSGNRWWALVLVILVAQLGLVVWLGDYEPSRPTTAKPGPLLKATGSNAQEMLALADPTLFALPHRDGFSGPAWLSVPSHEIQPFAWNEPPRFLEIPVERLAASFPAPVTRHTPGRAAGPADFPPELLLTRADEKPLFADRSTFHLEGALAGRPLKSPLDLPPWPHADLLTNSVVQVLVSPEGTPLSTILLGPGCGLKEADDYALKLAAAARFAPLPFTPESTSPLSGLVWGELIFEWHTVPATNTPAQKP